MEYISHEDYKKMMGKFQAEAPKGKLLKESWRSDPTDEEGEAYSEMLIDELIKLFKDGKISKDQLDAADDYINDHDYELFAASHGYDGFDSIGYILKQIGASVEEGNAFTAGLAKAKKGEKFKVGDKTFKDKTDYDAPVNEYQFDQMYPDDPGPFEGKDVDSMIKEFLIKEDDVNWDRMDDEEEEPMHDYGDVKQLAAKVSAVVGEKVRFDDYDMNDRPIFIGKKQDIEYTVDPAGTVFKHDGFTHQEIGTINERQVNESLPENDKWYEEGYSPDTSDFEQDIADQLNTYSEEELTEEEYQRALKALENPKVVKALWGTNPKKAAMALVKMVKGEDMEEGLNPAPFQATGPTIQTVEEKKNKFAHLTVEEREQLRQYVETIKTIKEQIKKMTNKSEMEEGGDMTNLVMKPTTMSEEGEVDAHEDIESKIDPKLHDTFHKVLDMVTKQLLNAGVEESQVQEFLKHEVSEMPDFVNRMYEKK